VYDGVARWYSSMRELEAVIGIDVGHTQMVRVSAGGRVLFRFPAELCVMVSLLRLVRGSGSRSSGRGIQRGLSMMGGKCLVGG
jgi:hypothetical protein